MTTLLGYITESLICGAIFWLLFKLVVQTGGSYQFQRGYLLLASVFTGIFPLINIPVEQTAIIRLTIPELYVYASGSGNSASSPGFWQNITGQGGIIFFWTISALFTVNFVFQQLLLLIISLNGEKTRKNGITVIQSNKISSPFSFFNSIYIHKGLSNNCLNAILYHESSHIQRGHSFDIVLISLIKIIQWFNPFIYLLRKSLVSVHEYQADGDVIERGFNIEEYQTIILNLQFGFSPSVTNSLHNSLTIKRFRKMKNLLKKKTSLWSVLVVVLFVSALFAVVSCKSRKEPEVIKEQAKVADKLQDAAAGTYSASANVSSKNDTVNFVLLSVKPTFNGKNEDEFGRWVAKNIVYPPIAKEKGIQGKVILNFMLNKEGKVMNVKVLKSANPLLDKEAVRVVSSSPVWTPGYKDGNVVNVIFTFPVVFKLN
jgi:TonB family protein